MRIPPFVQSDAVDEAISFKAVSAYRCCWVSFITGFGSRRATPASALFGLAGSTLE
jgi:hypothetical protein